GGLLLVALVVPSVALAQGARLQLDHLDRLAEKANDTVDVTVDTAMLKQTAGFLAGKGSDPAKVQQLLEGITGIYVKSFKFDAPDAYADSDVESVRKQMIGPGWSRVVGIREKRELTEIYFFREREVTGGLVVIAAQANELTIVNIVGRVDLAALGALGPMIPKFPGAMRKVIPR
ncbi:MAG: DUF4252 domain-containing protein, partial [Clostridia bacterium]|nr:DUF4252 domain-containing protein [Deltaproteobacteria bacterium]